MKLSRRERRRLSALCRREAIDFERQLDDLRHPRLRIRAGMEARFLHRLARKLA